MNVYTFGDEVYTVKSNGELWYNGAQLGTMNSSTGNIYGMDGALLGTMRVGANGSVTFSSPGGATNTGTYSSGASQPAQTAPTSPTSGGSTYTFGDEVYTVKSNGELWYNGAQLGTMNSSTGNIYGMDGALLGTMRVGANGSVTFSSPGGATNTGTYSSGASQQNVVGTITINSIQFSITDKGRLLENGADIGYVVTDVNGGYNFYDTNGNYFLNMSTQGVITMADGTISEHNAYFDIYDQQSYVADITISNADGSTTVLHLGNNGQLYDDNKNVVGSYQKSADGRNYDLFNTNGSSLGNLDSATNVFTQPDGSTGTASFTPIEHNIPMHSSTSSSLSSSGSKSGTSVSQTNENIQKGIDWSSPVAAALKTGVIDTSLNLPDLAKQAGVQAQEKYTNLMTGIGLPQYQGTLNNLAGKNMLSSSVAGSSMANVQQQMNQAIASQAFDASLASTQAQMQVPGELSGIIAALGGQVGTSTGTTTGSTSESSSQTGTTTGSDPLAPYYLMSDMSV